MPAPTFTLTAGEGFASRIGTTREALAGAKVVLKPSIRKGELLAIDGPESIEIVVEYLDDDGKLNGDEGIELLANDDSLSLSKPLQWSVTVEEARSQGFTRAVREFGFDAPTAGSLVSLDQMLPEPGQDWTRGRSAWRIVGGEIVDGALTLVNEDGSTVGPITIPNGAVALVDNGDSTWSVA